MIKENVNGIATPIKKLYEYVGGTKQEIQERYEYVNGRKELVFKNKTIKTIQLVDANGNPLNGVSGGAQTDYIFWGSAGTLSWKNYYIYDPNVADWDFSSSGVASFNRGTLGIGQASNKKITRIYGKVGGTLDNSLCRSDATVNCTRTIYIRNGLNNNVLWQRSINGKASTSTYYFYNINLNLAPNTTINNLKITITINNKRTYERMFSTEGRGYICFQDLWVEYEE